MLDDTELITIRQPAELPVPRDALVSFLHHQMKPYNDTLEDVGRALDYAFSTEPGRGGLAVLAMKQGQLVGAIVFLRTGMEGYIPQNLLLFVVVDPTLRGQGLGQRLIRHGMGLCDGAVKLHVEHDNPARRLYERMGFTSKYVEMRHENPR